VPDRELHDGEKRESGISRIVELSEPSDVLSMTPSEVRDAVLAELGPPAAPKTEAAPEPEVARRLPPPLPPEAIRRAREQEAAVVVEAPAVPPVAPRIDTRDPLTRRNAGIEISVGYLFLMLVGFIRGALSPAGVAVVPAFADINPHPFWLVILPAAALYGARIGAMAAAAGALIFGVWMRTGLGHTPTLGDMVQPFFFLVTAIVVGEIRDRFRRRREPKNAPRDSLRWLSVSAPAAP
jgi:hypothetical protein